MVMLTLDTVGYATAMFREIKFNTIGLQFGLPNCGRTTPMFVKSIKIYGCLDFFLSVIYIKLQQSILLSLPDQ